MNKETDIKFKNDKITKVSASVYRLPKGTVVKYNGFPMKLMKAVFVLSGTDITKIQKTGI